MSTEPIKIKFKDSKNEYQPIEVVSTYFKSISISIYKKTGIKVSNKKIQG